MDAKLDVNNVLSILKDEEYKAYGIYKVLSTILKANGKPEVRSQMMYNYLRNGMIVKGQKIFGPTLRTVTKLEVAEFLTRYCNKHDLALPTTEEVAVTESDTPETEEEFVDNDEFVLVTESAE